VTIVSNGIFLWTTDQHSWNVCDGSRRQVSATTRINEANDSAVIKTSEIFECEGRGKFLCAVKTDSKSINFQCATRRHFWSFFHRIKRNRWDTWPPTTPMIECEWKNENKIYL